MGKGKVFARWLFFYSTGGATNDCATRLRLELPPPDTKLSHLRESIAEYTQLPVHSFKTVHAGAVMKDDNAPSMSSFRSVSLYLRTDRERGDCLEVIILHRPIYVLPP